MSERVDLIIHGHFYQPPREDPWLEEIEGEPSAAPFNNWNERIHSECYRPNANSRILTETEKIVAIDNNYEHLSFNFGPTLLSWMDKYDPDTLAQIVKADAVSREQRSGHGNAIAQGYNHIIMPLANARDKETQIVWGARDFEHRFSRPPEAMWMPETAVDLKTLAELVRLGLEFVILSPYQASSVQSEEGEWRDVEDGSIDTSCAYRVETDAGPISVFFYHGPISAEISFMHLLRSGETFMNRLIESINGSSMLNMATDGEIYGHHEKFGDMCIAYAFSEMSDKDSEFAKQFRLTNYGEFLERNPPTLEAKIKKGGSSWSCEHGIERWQSNCGCRNDTSRPPFQQWRESLRVGLNDLRDQLQEIFEERGSETIKDVYGARNDYINVILSGFDEERKKDFASRWFKVRDREEESWRLLESQRNGMLMFTSCGWFFDDLGGIEPGQLMAYASRAIDAARPYIDEKAEAQFVKTLAEGSLIRKR
ncbi:MAG: DUF3536 domain-containing protein [Candidatus Lindowbacteria bacterium]|nr:DUF3536 domain-containing protein [Candidatus Lindowbacteria bacterium]